MENREILIANTKTQRRNKIVTDATTLGELKAALDRANIDYYGMTFTEGISKTQLLDDATQLPQNVMFKGQPTNNLVILLTNTKKNIASGALSRQDAYAIIKSKGLQDAVKSAFGRNFTQVPTADLALFLNKYGNAATPKVEAVNEKSASTSELKETSSAPSTSNAKNADVSPLATLMLNVLDSLADSDVLNSHDLNYLAVSLGKLAGGDAPCEEPNPATPSVASSNITDDDINDIIDEFRV